MSSRRRVAGRDPGSQAHEGRTVVVLLLGGLGAVLMAFVLGINIGQERAPGDAPPTEAQVLRTLDSQAARLRQVRAQERTELSFHDTLTGPARAARGAASASKPGPATALSPAPAAAPGTPDSAPVATAPTEPAPATAATEAAEAAAIESTEAAPSSAGPARFSLQVGAFPDENSAAGLRRRLQDKGYQVRIATSQVEGRGTWYRVRVGSYSDRTAAEEQRTQLSSSEGLFALVVPET